MGRVYCMSNMEPCRLPIRAPRPFYSRDDFNRSAPISIDEPHASARDCRSIPRGDRYGPLPGGTTRDVASRTAISVLVLKSCWQLGELREPPWVSLIVSFDWRSIELLSARRRSIRFLVCYIIHSRGVPGSSSFQDRSGTRPFPRRLVRTSTRCAARVRSSRACRRIVGAVINGCFAWSYLNLVPPRRS